MKSASLGALFFLKEVVCYEFTEKKYEYSMRIRVYLMKSKRKRVYQK